MALPFAHSAAGYLIYEATRPAGPHRPALLTAAVAFANAPDLDFLPGMLTGHPGAWHRSYTHSLGAVVAVGAVLLVVMGLRSRSSRTATRAALWAAAVWSSHLLIDFFTADAASPHGARFLWPFSRGYYLASTTLLDEAVVDGSGRSAFVASLMTPHALAVWGYEFAFLVGAVLAVHAVRAFRARTVTSVRGVAEGS